jgi:hypothetical protein
MSTRTYVKQPLEVQALQYTEDNLEEMREFCGTALIHGRIQNVFRLPDPTAEDGSGAELWVNANQRYLPIEVGEWVIQDDLGFYPCKDRKFKESYLLVEDLPELTFQQELSSLINKHSLENGSNTPDFVLATYLNACLESFDAAVKRRTEWMGGEEGGPW